MMPLWFVVHIHNGRKDIVSESILKVKLYILPHKLIGPSDSDHQPSKRSGSRNADYVLPPEGFPQTSASEQRTGEAMSE